MTDIQVKDQYYLTRAQYNALKDAGELIVGAQYYITDSNCVTYDDESLETPSMSGYELITNKVTSLSSSSTDTQYPSAKVVYDNLISKYTKPVGGIPASDLAQSYYLSSNPSGYTDDTVANTKYTKPAGGIPASDLAEAYCLTNDSRLSDARTPLAHTQAASTINTGTLGGQVVANTTAISTLENAQVRNITISTSSPSSSTGNNGDIWIKYS